MICGAAVCFSERCARVIENGVIESPTKAVTSTIAFSSRLSDLARVCGSVEWNRMSEQDRGSPPGAPTWEACDKKKGPPGKARPRNLGQRLPASAGAASREEWND